MENNACIGGLTFASLGALEPRVLLWGTPTLLVPTATGSATTQFAIAGASAHGAIGT